MELSIISIQDGILLGLRFPFESKLRIAGILGAEALDSPGVHVVQNISTSDVLIELPGPSPLSQEAMDIERAIHATDGGWESVQTGSFLLHQIRPNLRCNMVSPLAALTALQRNVGDGISYLSKQGEIFLSQYSIEVLPARAAGSRNGYLCGPDAVKYTGIASSRLLRYEDMHIEHALRSELQGLGHLFALTVGAALHLVKSAAPHRPKNS
ncbi:MAG TPA: hypothetical protein VFH43_10865 [Candidatus Kapabacteria bacterium]|nr:hypothetical protein [Candidatus Kapabacteria bacterium]